MFKKTLITALNFTFIGVASINAAYAGDWYVSANAAYSDPSSKLFDDGTNGAGTSKSDIDSATRFGALVGFEVTSAFNVELEYSIAGYDSDTSKTLGTGSRELDTFGLDFGLDVNLLTINASYEFENDSKFTPFVKGGLGMTFYDIKGDFYVSSNGGNTFAGFLPASFAYEGDGSEFAYFLGAGVSYELSDNTDLTLEYRYVDLGEVATDYDTAGDRIQSDLQTSDIQIGLRYYFR